MRKQPVVYLVGGDLGRQRDLIATLEATGLHLAIFASADDFVSQYKGREYGCLVLDWRPGDIACARLLKSLGGSQRHLPIIVIIDYGAVTVTVEVVRLGVVDYLHGPLDRQALITKIRAALENANMVRASAARLSVLTPREREMLQLLIEGKSSKQIASEKGLSLRTVKNHRTHLLAKTGAENTADMVRMAMVAGITHITG